MTPFEKRQKAKLYYVRNKEHVKKRMRLYYKEHPLMVWAHNTLFTEIRARRIERMPCEICGTFPSDAHHDDHSQPLSVQWLCRIHHYQLHEKQRQRKIA